MSRNRNRNKGNHGSNTPPPNGPVSVNVNLAAPEPPNNGSDGFKVTKEIVVPIVVALVAAAAVVIPALISATRANERATEAESQLKGFQFSVPIFSKLPGDCDFLIRGIRIDRQEGKSVTVAGPSKGDAFQVQVKSISSIGRDAAGNPEYGIQFTVAGEIGGHALSPSFTATIPLKRGSVSKPVTALRHDYYVGIEEVEIDFITVVFARRPSVPKSANLQMQGNSGPFGSIAIKIGKPPDPILTNWPAL